MEKILLSFEEVRKTQIEILRYIKKVCDENDLTYYLCGGTMLGAVRHKGFIPWDDDIDLLMMRDDFTRLVQLLKDGETYRCISHITNSDYYYPFAKVVDTRTELSESKHYPIKGLGVNVDIFPIDYFPNSEDDVKKLIKSFKRYRGMMEGFATEPVPKLGFTPRKAGKFVVSVFAHAVSWQRWLKKLNNVVDKYSHDENPKYAGNIVWGYGRREMVPVEAFAQTVELEFEGEMYKCPVGYDTYLKCLFNDYMKLPPKEQQVTHHDYDAYRIR